MDAPAPWKTKERRVVLPKLFILPRFGGCHLFRPHLFRPYPLAREQAAYNFLRYSRHWEQMSLWDRSLLDSRIRKLGGTTIE